jgi:hypothetical protein
LIEINADAKFRRCQNSTVLDFYVMTNDRHWGAPLMLAALAGVIQDCQCADGQEHNRSDDNC